MINALLTTAALLGSSAVALNLGIGSAIVVNNCDYNIYLANTPSAGGGFSPIVQTLSPGGQYSQIYTELSNGNGWSLKLTQTPVSSNVLQYEYTFHNDGTLWYDLSEVNGNPWNGNWEITATGPCTPRQAAYQYSTDDAYGMQSCPDTSSVTVTVCSGSSSTGSNSSAAAPAGSSSAAAPSSSALSPPIAKAPAPSAPSVPALSGSPFTWNGGAKFADASTLATVSTKADDGVTVTNVHTEVVTQYVTATASPHAHARRHAHHHHHA